MEKAAIKVGSVTYASKGKDILARNGFKVFLTRDTNPARGEGCGYLLRVEGNVSKAVALLKKNNIKVYGVTGTDDFF